MQEQNANVDTCQDEELCDILIAISVIAKRLAKKLSALDTGQPKETTHGENIRTDGKDRHS